MNYNKIKGNSTPDLFVTGFNTPTGPQIFHLVTGPSQKIWALTLCGNGRTVSYGKARLVTGNVDAINNVDAQVTCRIPAAKSTIKFGAANVFNNRRIQYAGGPTIGGLYYVAWTLENLF